METKLTNPKLIFKGAQLLLIDAPEKRCTLECESYFLCFDEPCKKYKEYEEALSKAPTWEIKKTEDYGDILTEIQLWETGNTDQIWQPEQGKLYDIPAGYRYKIEQVSKDCEKNCEKYRCFLGCYYPIIQKFAILIPQQEVKREQKQLLGDLMKTDQEHGMYGQEDLINELLDISNDAEDNELHEDVIAKIKSKFKITRL